MGTIREARRDVRDGVGLLNDFGRLVVGVTNFDNNYRIEQNNVQARLRYASLKPAL
jgi:hypothetical protein